LRIGLVKDKQSTVDGSEDAEGGCLPPMNVSISAHSKRVIVFCFDTFSQVLILRELDLVEAPDRPKRDGHGMAGGKKGPWHWEAPGLKELGLSGKAHRGGAQSYQQKAYRMDTQLSRQIFDNFR
jgi:hypothetical protein